MKQTMKLQLEKQYGSKLAKANEGWEDKLFGIIDKITNGGKIPEYLSCVDLQKMLRLVDFIGMYEYKQALNFMQNLDTIIREDYVPNKIWDLLHKINGVEY